eukprot:s244_g18.t1
MGGIDLAANWDFSFPNVPRLNIFQYILGGICVGIGTRAGKGCTSGHGICGLPRLSLRSWRPGVNVVRRLRQSAVDGTSGSFFMHGRHFDRRCFPSGVCVWS